LLIVALLVALRVTRTGASADAAMPPPGLVPRAVRLADVHANAPRNEQD